MEYEIVATLGPSSEAECLWEAMLSTGVTAFRLNTSHLSLRQVQGWLDRLAAFLVGIEPRPAVVLDLQGSKWRLGEFPSFGLEPGQWVDLVFAASADQVNVLPIPHADFFEAAEVSGGEIVLDDARVDLMVETAEAGVMRTRVRRGGRISSRKGITYASSEYRKESLGEKDQEIVKRTEGLDSVRYALSYGVI